MAGRALLVVPVLLWAAAACSTGGDSGESTSPSADTAATTPAEDATAPPPQDTISEDTAPEDTAPEDTISQDTISEDTVAEPDVTGVLQPDGFTTATVRISKADGEVCDVCMWLADDGAERGRGLMGVTDLGEPVGMAFVFPQPVDGAFYMFRTPTPLSIAWFAPDGAFVSATDMEPCLSSDSTTCPRFNAAGTYQLAIEVFEGDLGELGLGPGSSAVVLAGSESDRCTLAEG